jgi:radical SAM protein with 4Fe4S-binding SPASM domain
LDEFEDGPRYACDLLWTTLAISAEGNMMYCCQDYRLQSGLANIADRPLREIWKEQVSQERRRHVDNAVDQGPCQNCDAWKTRLRPKALSVKDRIPSSIKREIKRVLRVR